ncbi:hypothetical protein DN069_36975 [Streptacidiphilus pinicola]|uniref:Uncharacterized protein n=1 Tax=Streptacidiphilus pinicola TaxID=2219663 RepID=A0A2X0IAH1_9ACTN|nr:hypothetical protein DN069_36975 [Streptacidiphilus pinicola]
MAQQPVGSQKPQIAERITVALTNKSKESLQTILDEEDMTNKTDAVNRSLNMRAFFLARAGEWELVLRNRANGETHVVHFL